MGKGAIKIKKKICTHFRLIPGEKVVYSLEFSIWHLSSLIGPVNTWLRVPEGPLSGWRRGGKERHGKWNARIHRAPPSIFLSLPHPFSPPSSFSFAPLCRSSLPPAVSFAFLPRFLPPPLHSSSLLSFLSSFFFPFFFFSF